MRLPADKKKLATKITNVIGDCRISQDTRLTLYRSLRQWKLTGSPDGNAAIYNKLGTHIARTSGYLFSPVDLRFNIEFENDYSKNILMQSEVGARYLTKQFEKRDMDIRFSQGVEEALTYGACLFKQNWGHSGLGGRLVMPWNFGVYNESRCSLDEQEALCETVYITADELWRRISHLSDADKIYKKALSHAKKTNDVTGPENYFHQVMIGGVAPVIDVTTPMAESPGGSVNTDGSALQAMVAPSVAANLIAFHELTVVDDDTGDYTTIQFVEPDIIITPKNKKYNLFLPQQHAYTLIQPNPIEGCIWGISEIQPLLKLQNLLRERMEDIKKIMGLQYDQLLAFIGFSGLTDDMYDGFKQAGFIAQENPGAKVENLTPKLPTEAFADINEVLRFMDEVSGFANILSGQGEAGVRSGNHASTLMKTASPRLRDKAILTERQCSEVGNKSFELLRVKEANAHWVGDGLDPTAEFLLSSIPEDFRVVVDSHSSSPIYEEDHKQLALLMMKAGVIDGESFLDLVHVPMRDILKARLKLKQEKEAQMIKEHPELLTKGKGKGMK